MDLKYILNKKTDGANPFKIFAALEKMDKAAIASGIKRMSYSQFLDTAYWFAVASVAKSRAGMRCQVCNGTDRIQTHHRTYDTHGFEHMNMVDLVVLDDNCHGLFHGHQPLEYVPERLKMPKPKKGRIIPGDVDLTMPDGDPVILTRELINRCRANGSFTTATMRAFGLTHPLGHGWVATLIGTPITRANLTEALKGRFIYGAPRLERRTS